MLKYITEVNNPSHTKWRYLTKEFSFQHSKMQTYPWGMSTAPGHSDCSVHIISRETDRGSWDQEPSTVQDRGHLQAHHVTWLYLQDRGNQREIFKKTRWILTGLTFLSILGLPGGSVISNPPANAGDKGSMPGLTGSHMLQNNLASWAKPTCLNYLKSCAPREAHTQQQRVAPTPCRKTLHRNKVSPAANNISIQSYLKK